MQISKWERGVQFINKGCDKHEGGDKDAAARLYERGIQLCLDHVKSMAPSDRKFKKQQQINVYLELLANLRPENKQFAAKRSQSHKSLISSNSRPRPQYKQNKRRLNGPSKKPLPAKRARSKHDEELYQRIEDEIIGQTLGISFDDVVGLENVKQALLEAVILPARRPDIFVGPRAPPKGLLLFGPPGNGKTFIAKARWLSIHTQSLCALSAPSPCTFRVVVFCVLTDSSDFE